VKALSIRQPWVELILRGRKTIEVRKWNTRFRGRFLLHASKKVDDISFEGIDKDDLVRGAIVGSAILKDVIIYNTKEEFERDYEKHLSKNFPKSPMFGFLLEDVRRFERAIRVKGKLGFFEVSVEGLEGEE